MTKRLGAVAIAAMFVIAACGGGAPTPPTTSNPAAAAPGTQTPARLLPGPVDIHDRG